VIAGWRDKAWRDKACGDKAWLKPTALAALVAALGFFGKTDLVTDGLSALTDRDLMIRWTSNFAGATRDAIPVTLIDVDAEAMAIYGAPDRIPRGLIAGLLDLAREKKAAGVFVDVDLSKPGPDPLAEAALRARLADWPADAPPVALALRFRAEGPTQALAAQPMVFADAVAGRADIRAAASLALTDGDGVARRWTLSQTDCAAGRAYPSPQLLAFAAAQRAPGAALDAYLGWRARAACGKDAGPRPDWPRNPAETANISFLFDGAAGGLAPEVRGVDGRETALFRRIPARSLIDAKGAPLPPASVSGEPFAGRFVIVGASHGESHDLHMTPLGRMPGAVVVANAVAGAPAILGAAPLGRLGRTLIALALFAALAAATARLRAAVAGLVVTLLCLAALPILGRLVAPSSALEIVAAALAMLAGFAALETLLEIAQGWRAGLRWRALLKPARPKETI